MRSKSMLLLVCLAAFGAGCAKKKVAAKPPASTPAPQVAQTTPAASAPARAQPRPSPAASSSPQVQARSTAPSSFSDAIAGRLQDIHFDYDRANVRENDGSTLSKDAATLKQIFRDFPTGKVMVEGDCDDRGSDEYNLALGDKRARATREYLSHLGVPDTRIDSVSSGKEHPVCTDDQESCWQKNRRAHFRAE